MGTWGTGPFENDDGADFRYLAENDPTHAISETLKHLAEAPADVVVSATQAAYAWAAAALVAAQHTNQPSGALDDEGDEWLTTHPIDVTDQLLADARAALERLRTGNELADLWEEEDEGDEFEQQLTELVNQFA